MISKSTLLHLRFPFSFFLMPVFGFALVVASKIEIWRFLLIFFIWHILVYPASNGFNSYFDKDEESIGGLEKPPPVSKELYFASLLLDIIALLFSLLINIYFFIGILIYGLASKSYSHPIIRLKKYAFWGLLTVGFFQGAFTLWISAVGLCDDINVFWDKKVIFAGVLSSALLLGSYPMTQIYQHNEDLKRGDKTISILLGIRGTFLFTLLIFGVVGGGYFLFFWTYFNFYIAN
ncbi:MAG: ubiquinone biosynthesis protein UbiA, partial [Bacteroidetes bacterium]